MNAGGNIGGNAGRNAGGNAKLRFSWNEAMTEGTKMR